MPEVLWLLGGGVLLYLGAEWLVSGASGLALSLRIPQIVVGLTVVAYGTSAPELVVGIQAAFTGHADVALGNVVGSNIANLGLILAASVLVRPARVDGALRSREIPVMVITALLLPLLLLDGMVGRREAIGLLLAAIAYSAWMIRATRGEMKAAAAHARIEADAAASAGAPVAGTRRRQVFLTVAGLGMLILGGRLFVDAATALALAWGLSERVVGLTIVAVGTSVPELATSLIAAARGHSDIAVGNVVGSNIFNVLLCLGVASLAGNVGAPLATVAFDLATLAAITLVAAFFLRTARTMSRAEGAFLGLLYVLFLGSLAAGR